MHRDVKPHNVMIDHEKRKVHPAVKIHRHSLTSVAETHRLGTSGVLSSRHRVQCEGCIKIF